MKTSTIVSIIILILLVGCTPRILFKSEPSKAKVFFKESVTDTSTSKPIVYFEGTTPIYNIGKNPGLYQARKDGYYDSDWIKFPKSDMRIEHYTFSLKPIEGFLKILCDSDFYIEIDNKTNDYSQDSCYFKALDSGIRTITVWRDFYNKEKFDIVIKPKELTVIN